MTPGQGWLISTSGPRAGALRHGGKNKIYSLHEPHVECIAKGKAKTPYEFGCKAGLVITARKNWILAAHALHGNPFDGKTLKKNIEQAEKNTGITVNAAFVDKGYRGVSTIQITFDMFISGKKRLSPSLKRLLKRRSAIEPIMGHTKHDHRMEVNLLKGKEGDKLNVLLAASAFNLRKLLRSLSFWLGWILENLALGSVLELLLQLWRVLIPQICSQNL